MKFSSQIYAKNSGNTGLKGKALLDEKKKLQTNIVNQNVGAVGAGVDVKPPATGILTWTQAKAQGLTQDQWKAGNAKLRAQGVPEPTVDDRAKAMIEQSQSDKYNLAQELGLDKVEKSALEMGVEETFQERKARELLEQQKKDLEYVTAEQGRADFLDRRNLGRFEDQANAAIGATTSAFAQGREGTMSQGRGQISGQYATEMGKQIEEANVRYESAVAQRERVMDQLQQAQAQGQDELAESLQMQLASAENKVRQADTAYLNSITAATQTGLDVQAQMNQNMNTAMNLVDSGVKMDMQSLYGLSKQLNIPFDVLNGYYQGQEQIRTDKSLNLEQKAMANESLKLELNRELAGLGTQEARKVDDFVRLSQSGKYSPDEIQALAVSMGISNENNPLWKAEMAIKSAQAKVDQYEAKNLGKPPAEGTIERLKYDQAQLELRVAQAEASKFTNEVPETIYADVLVPEGDSKYRVAGEWECAEATNRMTDGAHLGSTYDSKLQHVTKKNNPEIGNVMVWPHGSPNIGHADMVLNFNPVTQQVTVGGYNFNGNGKFSVRKYNIDELNQKYGDNWGFTDNTLKPEYKGKLEEKMITSESTSFDPKSIQPSEILELQSFLNDKKYPSEVQSDSQKKQFKQKFDQFVNYIKSDRADMNDVLAFSMGGKGLTQSEKEQLLKYEMTTDQLNELESMINDVDTGPILGALRSNIPYDTKAKLIEAKITSVVPALARGIYGEVGVLTDADVIRYTETLPNMRSTEDQKKLLMEMTQKMLGRGTEMILKNYAAGGSDVSGFSYLIPDSGFEEQDIDSIVDKYDPLKSNLYSDYGLSN